MAAARKGFSVITVSAAALISSMALFKKASERECFIAHAAVNPPLTGPQKFGDLFDLQKSAPDGFEPRLFPCHAWYL